MRPSVKVAVLGIASVVFGLTCLPSSRSLAEDSKPAATQPTDKDAKKQALIEQLEEYYAKLYIAPLRIEKDARLAHLVACVSLSRVSGAPLTKNLMVLASMAKSDPLVAQCGWEAVHARAATLQADQLQKFIDYGLQISGSGGFPGETAVGLLEVLKTQPIADKRLEPTIKMLVRVAEENDPATEFGKRTLNAGAAAVAAWSDPRVVNALIKELSGKNAKRVGTLLRGMPNPPAEDTAAAWEKWAKANELKVSTQLPALESHSAFFPAPETISNPDDAKWRKEAELPDLRINRLDVMVTIDATPSLADTSPFFNAFLEPVLLSLSTVTPKTRMGVVFYRCETNPAAQDECCKKTQAARKMMVNAVNPTPDVNQLLGEIKKQLASNGRGGHSGNGAYLCGIEAAAKTLGKPEKGTVQVICVTGDAKPTPQSLKILLDTCTKLKEAGVIMPFMIRDGNKAESLNSFSLAASDEKPLLYNDHYALTNLLEKDKDPIAIFDQTAFYDMATRVIAGAIPKAYGDRAAPITGLTWKILSGKIHADRARLARQ